MFKPIKQNYEMNWNCYCLPKLEEATKGGNNDENELHKLIFLMSSLKTVDILVTSVDNQTLTSN